MLTGGASRDELRAFYVESWRKSRDGVPLTPLESMICDVIGLHPEYQPLLGDAERAVGLEAAAADPATNPFLHMGLHIAIREQLSIDRPPGIRAIAARLRGELGEHRAEHELMQILAELLWEAQRAGRAPDEAEYIRRANARLQR